MHSTNILGPARPRCALLGDAMILSTRERGNRPARLPARRHRPFMGLLALNQLMSFRRRRRQRERRRRPGQIRDPNVLVSSFGNGNRSSRKDNGSPKGGNKMRYSGPDLPEDIWRHIHSLMPLRDAARAALVSRAFLDSWRHRPNITFSKTSLGLDEDVRGKDEITRDFNRKVDHILKKHSGVGLKSLKLQFVGYNANTHCYLNSWLKNAITPELEELTLVLPHNGAKYCFPSSLLSNGSGNSIRHLLLFRCTFSSPAGLDCLKNLTSLSLHEVRIAGDELGCLLLNSPALEQLELAYCYKIRCLNIPFLMKRLSCLSVLECDNLQVVEIKAPNISTFHFSSEEGQVQVSLAESSHVKYITLSMKCAISYSCVKLPSVVPNLETLSIGSPYEAVSTPMSPSKFLHLRFLGITLYRAAFTRAYDCFSVVSFLDAAPSLESFVLGVSQLWMQHDSIVGDPSPLRQMAGHCHKSLKTVTINGFCSAKSLVELTCYILENAASLDCLTLDSTSGLPRCSVNKIDKCMPMERDMVMESQKALLAIGSYIKDKVPPAVKLNVLGPCSLCQDLQL